MPLIQQDLYYQHLLPEQPIPTGSNTLTLIVLGHLLLLVVMLTLCYFGHELTRRRRPSPA